MNPAFVLEQPWGLQLALIFSIVSLRALLLAGGASLWLRLARWTYPRRIIKGVNRTAKLVVQAAGGLSILLLDTLVAVLLINTGVFRFMELPAGRAGGEPFLLTFAALFIWTEIYFYYSHRLLHHPKLFWIHRHHHQSMVMNPWTSLSFSYLERFILLAGVVVVPALISRVRPFPIEAYAAYFFFNYVFNVFGHLNVELVPHAWVKSPVGRVFFTPTYHALHHQRYRGHFGLFTSALDKWHGTYFKDYEAVHLKNKAAPAKGLQEGT